MNQEQIIRYLQLANGQPGTTDCLLHEPLEIEAIFISDVHLGYKGSMARELVSFLNHVKPKKIILDGDFIDGWTLGMTRMHHIGRLFSAQTDEPRLRLPQGHPDVLQKILRFARSGVHVFYIPGNHDDLARAGLSRPPDLSERQIERQLEFAAEQLEITGRKIDPNRMPCPFEDIAQIGNISIVAQLSYKTADNKRLLIMHGDEFDFLIKNRRYLGILGTKARDKLFDVSEWLSRDGALWPLRLMGRKLFGLDQSFSLADYVRKFKSNADMALPALAVEYVNKRNETIVQRRATQPDWKDEPLFTGYVGGHNHMPAATKLSGIDYFNCGDWVQHGTALIEHKDGRMELVQWNPEKGIVPFRPHPDRSPVAAASKISALRPDS